MLSFFSPNVLIAVAAGLYILGFLVLNQIVLRLFILAGTCAYIAYYATVADSPLWGAIGTSLLILGANLLGLLALMMRNALWHVPRAHRDIYPAFAAIPPADFRVLVQLAKRVTLPPGAELTRQDLPLSSLYFLIDSTAQVTKGRARFALPSGIFVGEVAYLTGNVSAATTHIDRGGEVLVWDLARLNRALRRRPKVRMSLDAMISGDLARKVALAVAPQDLPGPAGLAAGDGDQSQIACN